MTVFMTPDRDPFFCGTYFPREHFQRLVLGVAKAWREDRDNVTTQAREISVALAERAAPPRGQVLDLDSDLPGGAGAVLAPSCDHAVLALAESYDAAAGGFGGAPNSRRRWCSNSCSGTPRARGSATASPPRRRWGW